MSESAFRSPVESVGHRKLKDEQAKVFRRTVARGRAAAITNRNRVDAYLVPPAAFEEAQHALEDVARLRAVVPMLIAAATAGVALPSETLASVGFQPEVDWRAINRFQATYPIPLTHTEDGTPLLAVTDIRVSEIAENENEEELVIEHRKATAVG